MTPPALDPEVRLLASISASLKSDYLDEEIAWEASPFGWIRTRPSRQVGAIGECLVAGWCAAKGLDVVRSPDSDADRLVEGVRVEIKFSTLWHSGLYKFQQLRDQNYSLAICLGISPFDAHCWVLPKQRILQAWHKREPGMRSQHGGQQGTDTAWLSVRPEREHDWLRPYGGSLSEGLTVLRRMLAAK